MQLCLPTDSLTLSLPPSSTLSAPLSAFRYFGEIKMGNQSYCNNCYKRVPVKASAPNECKDDAVKTGKTSQSKCPIIYDGTYSFKAQCTDPLQQYVANRKAVEADRSDTKCMTQTQKKYMQYTLMSACTDADLPPSGPGWKDHRTNVKLNLLTADCRADTTCELW